MKHYTTIEQSKKLLELGLNPKTADMTYCAITEGMREKMIIKDWQATIGLDIAIKENLFSYRNGYIVPCWSLGALLEVMPKEIKTDDFWGNKRAFLNIGGDGSTPCVSYKVFTKDTEYYPEGVRSFHTCKEKSWIKTLYSMVVYLLENGYIKKESDN